MSEEKSPFAIPRLYVEGVEGEEYLVEESPGVFRRSKACVEGKRCFGKVIYGTMLEELVDLIAKKALKSFIVERSEKPGEGMLVEAGSYLEPIPVSGKRTVIEVLEGDEVKVGQVLGLIVTGKYELRKVRSHVEGIVVYIYSSPFGGPDENIVFIAPKDAVKRVKIIG